MFKRVYVIVNPAAGKVEPTLHYINSALKDKISWEMNISHKKGDAAELAKRALRRNFDAIVVYGGDGTVSEVAHVLFRKKTPLCIIPGGTANILAKELGIPEDTQDALKLLLAKKPKLKKIDVGVCNGIPFIVAVNVGFPARVMKSALRDHKNRFGRLAYGISTLKEIDNNTPEATYTLTTKNKKETIKGCGIIITNSTNVGISNISLINSSSAFDGKIDVIILKSSSIQTLFQLTKSALLDSPLKDQIVHRKISNCTIQINPEQMVECEDIYTMEKELNLKTAAGSLSVVIP